MAPCHTAGEAPATINQSLPELCNAALSPAIKQFLAGFFLKAKNV